MLINFAYEGLVDVDCNCLQLDGHSVTNLITVDRGKRTKGFLADRFIKPPVIITLTFKCNVDISKVVLNTRVRSLKSSGFEILRVFKNKTTSSIAQAIIEERVERVEFSRYDGSAGTVRFCSSRAGERIRQLQVKIFKTFGSGVPALGGLELWGRPSQNVPEHIKNEITELWKRMICGSDLNRGLVAAVIETAEEEKNPVQPCSKKALSQEITVPEEFIDPISCEIMTIPMILPSGNIVDLSTLEKFYSAEAQVGRGQSDPFTGVLFSEQSKPVAATCLKTRLDQFLLKNCDDPSIKVIPRTIGKRVLMTPRTSGSSAYSDHQTSCGEPFSSLASRSVDQLLVDCLEGLPSYLDDASAPKKVKIGCVNCPDSRVINCDSYMYQLPCQHLVCRKCLCVMKENCDASCGDCHQPFGFDSVQRHHVD